MRLLHGLLAAWHRVVALFRRRRVQEDIDAEMAFHLAMREAERENAGDPRDEARRAARRQFGNVAALREETRDMWTFPSFESLVQDVRFAVRTLVKAPGFTVVAVLALAIGIGANTAIFSLVDAMLLRGLPYAQSERLVLLWGNVQRDVVERRGGSYPDFLDWRAQSTAFDDLAAYSVSTVTVSGTTSDAGDPERLTLETASAPYFSLLGMTPTHGRVFRADEDEVADRDAVAVLGHAFWQRRFGGDPLVVGRALRIDGRPYEIVGIMPAGFRGLTDQAELWIPFSMSGPQLESRGSRWFVALGRLRDGVSIDQAQSELDAISARLAAEYPDSNAQRGVEVSTLWFETFGDLQPALLALMAAVTFVLLIACANVANLLIGRSELRQREIAVRTAMGAGRMRLLRQLVTESCVLAGVGALAGLGVAHLAVRALMAGAPVTFPSFVAPTLNLPVLLFTTGVALVCGLLLGVAPALHGRVSKLGDVLKGSARGSSAGSSRMRGALIVAEVSLAVVLLVGAGLMIRTVGNLTAIDPGFETESLLTLNVSIPRQDPPAAAAAPPVADATPPAPPPFVVPPRDLIDLLGAVPGVTEAALSSDLPLGGGSQAVFYAADGDDTTSAETRPRAYVHRVTPGFFRVVGMPLLQGRTFLESELTPEITAVIVSESVVRRFWPNADPIGRLIRVGSIEASIVGVVPDTKYRGLPDNPTADPDLFFPYAERGAQGVVLRTAVPPASVAAAVQAAIRRADPNIVIFGVTPMADLIAAQTSQSRFTTWLMGLFAGTALLLAVVGIYGVMSYLVTQRTREFGIRLALGATRGQIVRVVVRQGASLIAAGMAIGVAAAFGLSRLLQSLLFGVQTTDPSAGMPVLLLAVAALAACLVPAMRATRVEPVVALRNE